MQIQGEFSLKITINHDAKVSRVSAHERARVCCAGQREETQRARSTKAQLHDMASVKLKYEKKTHSISHLGGANFFFHFLHSYGKMVFCTATKWIFLANFIVVVVHRWRCEGFQKSANSFAHFSVDEIRKGSSS